MFIIRRAKPEDVATLLKLARMVHFINLPADRSIIEDKVRWSGSCFEKAAANSSAAGKPRVHTAAELTKAPSPAGLRAVTRESDLFMFVLEETETGGVLGTSQIIARMGGPGRPNLSFELTRREMFSQALQLGTRHTIAKLRLDESGPTELGGLVLQPSFRGHKLRLGRLLSIVRFHFIGLKRHLFSSRLLAEMAGPTAADGRSMFWEYLGRRFINLPYEEADRFCQYSREFMLSLLPREELYLTLLPPEATCAVGEVGAETIPARKLLEKLGFKYLDRIDPFDGGPHLEAETDHVELVRSSARLTLGEASEAAGAGSAIVSTLAPDGEFRAIETSYTLDKSKRVRLPAAAMSALNASAGAACGFTPMGEPAGAAAPRPTGRTLRAPRAATRV